jgi:alcohol dehydrogenase (NADP+)
MSIDCAAVYKNEREIGEALQEGMKELGLKRKDIFITSKLWNTEHHPENITHACHQTIHVFIHLLTLHSRSFTSVHSFLVVINNSLSKDLRTDYVDCYLMHWPVAFVRGNGTHPKNPDGTAQYEDIPLWETWEAMQVTQSTLLCPYVRLRDKSVPTQHKISP